MHEFAGAGEVARAAADAIAEEAGHAIGQRGRFTLAVSGGRTPWLMLRELAAKPLPWDAIHVFQVDERIAGFGDPDRNLTHILESLQGSRLPPDHVHAMPVEMDDLDRAARVYGAVLRDVCGVPPAIDVVHLGLGPDGHTASLVPGDAVIDVTDADVALTGGVYQGRRRMTLTYPTLDRARRIIWVVTGAEKAPVLKRLHAGDPTIPAGRVRSEAALVFADAAAAGAA
jgi:6-phosphogluconolactonase